MHARFDEVDSRFDGIDGRFDGVDRKLDKLPDLVAGAIGSVLRKGD